MEEFLDLGKKAVTHAEKLGADEAEIFLYKENRVTVKFVGGVFASRSGVVKGLQGAFVRVAEPWIKKKGVPITTSGTKAGVGIRSVVNKAMGFSSVSSLEEEKILEAVEESVKIAKIRPADPNWVSLPKPKKTSSKGGVFDKKVAELNVEEILQLCSDCCVVASDYDKRIIQAMTMIAAASVSFGIVNTYGIEAYDNGTFFNVFVETKAKSGTEEVASGSFLMTRNYSDNLRSIALNASENTIESFNKKPLPEKFVGTVVFENVSWNELFSVIFAYGISALNVQENRSVYKDKIAQQVAKENVSIVDDGLLPEGYGTSKIDDEGVPRQRTPIIEKGVLSNFLYDNYTANREKREATGNANRRGLFGPPAFARQPLISPSNLLLVPDKGSLEDLVKEIENGVLVKGSLIGAGHSNVVTGDFSVTAENAFKIEHGEIAYPLKPCTVAGNLYEALNSVVVIGNDLKTYENVICPSIAIEKIVVST